jgi:hypothetical protein
MKKIFVISTILLGSVLSLQAQDRESIAAEEAALAARMIERVQQITKRIEVRLSEVEPIVKTMPASESQPTAKTLSVWMQNGKAQKLEVSEPGKKSNSIFYFADDELFFVSQPYSRFIFIGGQLEYWLNDKWEPNQVERSLLLERENMLYDEVNGCLTWLYAQYKN